MAKPAFLRYLPARLKPLSSPAIWAPLTIFVLLSAFLWEYHRNPDWFNRTQADNIAPESNLTPEEEARLSEIDTLDVLIEGSRMRGTSPEANGLTDPASLEAGATDGAAPGEGLSGRNNPFAAYEDEYKFPGAASSQRATPPALPSSGANPTPTPASTSPNAATSNALSDALDRQRENSEAVTQPSTSSAPSSLNPQPAARPNSDGFSGSVPSSGSNPSETSGAQPPSSGITTPFIRTTTDMSPPAGTTGYQTPASSSLPVFNAPPQQPTQGPFSGNQSIPQNSIPQNNFRQSIQPPAPAATSLPTPASPNVNSYTPPSFTQPQQNRSVR